MIGRMWDSLLRIDADTTSDICESAGQTLRCDTAFAWCVLTPSWLRQCLSL